MVLTGCEHSKASTAFACVLSRGSRDIDISMCHSYAMCLPLLLCEGRTRVHVEGSVEKKHLYAVHITR